jgi:hypothetical protein
MLKLFTGAYLTQIVLHFVECMQPLKNKKHFKTINFETILEDAYWPTERSRTGTMPLMHQNVRSPVCRIHYSCHFKSFSLFQNIMIVRKDRRKLFCVDLEFIYMYS